MRSVRSIRAAVLAMALPALAPCAFDQPGASAKVCGYLPTAELEGLFGSKVAALRGSDGAMMSLCGATFADRRFAANLVSNPPSSTVTLEQRIAAVKPALERKGLQITSDGKVACFGDSIELGGNKLPTAACFRQDGGYLSLTLQGDDAKRISFETVKRLLDKAAALRK